MQSLARRSLLVKLRPVWYSAVVSLCLPLFLCGWYGCAGGVASILVLDRVPLLDHEDLPVYEGNNVAAYVAPFIDSRLPADSPTNIGRVPGNVYVGGQVPVVLTDLYSKLLAGSGVRLVFKANRVVQGEILEWRADLVDEGLMATISARAKLRITVKDGTGRPLLAVTYLGEEVRSKLIAAKTDVQDTLLASLQTAVRENLRDQRFIDVLRTGKG